MQELHKRVQQASRRLTAQIFVRALPWCLLASIFVACLAIAAPKIWPLAIAEDPNWAWYWLGGSAAVGLLSAIVFTLIRRRGMLDAAIEFDQRLGLKERVSSTLALTDEEAGSPAGQALVEDAMRRAKNVDVRSRVSGQPSWHGVLPVGAAVLALLVAFLIEDATKRPADAASVSAEQMKKEIEKNAEALKKKLAKRKQEALAKGLKDADTVFEKLERGLDDIQKNNKGDFKKALVKINNLTKELADKQKALGGAKEMQRQFEQLKNIQQGPADKIAKALKNGNFEKAIKELNELKEKMASNELSEEEKKKVEKQIQELKEQFQKMKDSFEQTKQDLKDQIEQKKREGDLAAANDLQKQLDQLQQQNSQMQQLQEMANQLAKCEECMNQGDQQGAAEALSEMAQNLQGMQDELDQLETLGQAMDQIADAKDAICKACEGGQFQGMNGNGMSGQMQRGGQGMGDGRGEGDRPEEESETGNYDARERGNLQRGQAVRTGDANGQNRAGQSLVGVEEEIESAFSEDPDPILNQRLPRNEKRQVNEYFEQILDNK